MGAKVSADWASIRIRYEKGQSVSSIAKEYGVARTTISDRASREGWKKGAPDAAVTEKAITADASSLLKADAKKLLIRIDQMIEAKSVKPSNIRFFTGALKDLKEVLDVKSRRDIKEQEAKIAMMQKQIDAGGGNDDITITINGGNPEWAE